MTSAQSRDEVAPVVFEVLLKHPNAKLPTRGSEQSAGYDLYTPEGFMLKPGETKTVWLGFCASFPKNYVGLIWDRSSLGAKGIHIHGGVIDSDYRGEWGVILHNNTSEYTAIFEGGMRIAQVVFQRHESWPVVSVDELNKTFRGDGGLGSTGK